MVFTLENSEKLSTMQDISLHSQNKATQMSHLQSEFAYTRYLSLYMSQKPDWILTVDSEHKT